MLIKIVSTHGNPIVPEYIYRYVEEPELKNILSTGIILAGGLGVHKGVSFTSDPTGMIEQLQMRHTKRPYLIRLKLKDYSDYFLPVCYVNPHFDNKKEYYEIFSFYGDLVDANFLDPAHLSGDGFIQHEYFRSESEWRTWDNLYVGNNFTVISKNDSGKLEEVNPRKGESISTTIEGQKISGSYLGAGHYVRKAMLVGDKVYLIMKHTDLMKDVLAENKFDSPHIPPTERIFDNIKGEYTYIMPYYKPITPMDKDAWITMKELNRAKGAVEHSFLEQHGWVTPLYQYWYELGNAIIKEARVRQPIKDALTDLLNTGGNYGSVMFEFGRRNIGVDKQGRIVFRDIIFDAEKMYLERFKKPI